MTRRIVTERLDAGGGVPVDEYSDKLIKNIPADIVAAWIAVTGLIAGDPDAPKTVLWIAFALGVVLTAVWTWRQTTAPNKPTATTQIAISTGSFMVWVFALGGPFTGLNFYRPLYGSLLLILYTLIVPLVNPPEG